MSMVGHYNVIDCDAGRGWTLKDEQTAVRYAAARHAATGNVIEVIGTRDDGSESHIVLPPDAPVAIP
ncbi:MAG: hypothetical protein ACR2NR_19285 [Solirubrobacteraceae bacterium]